MTIVATTARDLQAELVAALKSDDLPRAFSLAKQGAESFPTDVLAGGHTFGQLRDGLAANLKPVNRPVTGAPVSAPAAAAPVSAAPVSAPVSAAPAVAPVSAPAVAGGTIVIEYSPKHGTISRGSTGADVFAELGWGYARKLGWHYLGDRGKSPAESAETVAFAIESLQAAGFDVQSSITGTEVAEVAPAAPATRKRGSRKSFPVSGAPVSAAPAAAAPVSAAPVSAPARARRAAAPVSAAPAAAAPADPALAAILAMLKTQGETIAALQAAAAAPVSAAPIVAAPVVAAPVSVAPVSAPAAADTADDATDDATDDGDYESAEDVLSRVLMELAPKRTREAAALAWRFIVRDGAHVKRTAEDLRGRLNAEVAGYYRDNRIGSITFSVMRVGSELTVTVKSATGEIVPSKLRAQVQGIGLTTRGVDRAAAVKSGN